MRKQNIGFLLDKFFWYTLYMLPLFIYIVAILKDVAWFHTDIDECFGISYYTLETCVDMCADYLNVNIVYKTLSGIFCHIDSIMPFGSFTGVIYYLSYVIMLNIIHIFVDVLLFIPRWCHRMLRKGEDYVED